MAFSPSTPAEHQPGGLNVLGAIARLAGWRFKRMWHFLLVSWLGMLAMVVLACAPPLFSRVAISANLRAVAAAPDGRNIVIQVSSLSPTAAQQQQISSQLEHLIDADGLGTYLRSTPQQVVQSPPLALPTNSAAGKGSAGLVLNGYDPVLAAQHTSLVQGRLPQATGAGSIEIAITRDLASDLGLHLHSVIKGHIAGAFGSQAWTLRVVGIIAPRSAQDPFWLAPANPFGSLYRTTDGSSAYDVLAAPTPLRDRIAALQTLPGKDPSNLFWSYPFDLSQLDANSIPALAQQLSALESQVESSLPQINGVIFATPYGPLFETLSNYAQRALLLELIFASLLLLTLTIILFLVGTMAYLLVEQQHPVIATLRSRGAQLQHIFVAFAAQGVAVALAALLVGPALALLLVQAIARALLTAADQQSLDVISRDPIQAALAVKWYAASAVALALVIMLAALRQSATLDIVALRGELARSQREPFWRRFKLDLLVILLIVGGYAVYAYLWQSLVSAGALDPLTYNLLKAGSFVAPPLLVAALLMLFLRLFPLILRLAASLAAAGRSAPAMLACAGIERAPRPAARILVLLALAIAACCFLSTLIATQNGRASSAASYAVGADFSGNLPISDAFKSFNALKTQYSNIAGVQSATVGYNDILSQPVADAHIVAPDADTYSRTALWPAYGSAQPLALLGEQLLAHRSAALARSVVYALVDSSLAQKYSIAPGDAFSLTINESGTLRVQFIALAVIDSIPGTYNSPLDSNSDAGLVVDYQSYAAAYARVSGMTLEPNFVWLRSKNDASSLAHIRSVLPGLQDRRALAAINQENSVHLDIVGVLTIGVLAALVMALIGTLLTSWLSASSRRTSFAILRALGMAPRQVAAVLLWEQGLVYTLALLLGLGMGALLAGFTPQIISLLDLAGPAFQDNPYDVPPVQVLVPYPQLFLLLGGIAISCLLALLLMAGIVSRPSIDLTLRLNED